VRFSHVWALDAPRFDEQSLVSCAGLVPVLALAEQTGLKSLLARVVFGPRRSGPARSTRPGNSRV
jgi:hypothetical protein